MSDRILIAGAGPNQVGMVTKAREMGLFTIAVDGNPEAPGLMAADVAEVADICDPDESCRKNIKPTISANTANAILAPANCVIRCMMMALLIRR